MTPAARQQRSPGKEHPLLGQVLAGRFRLEEVAGRGGMGTVYRARDLSSGATVALKLLNPSAEHETLLRFHREAELLASLRHPNIVSHVAHGITEQTEPFLAMQWLEGEDLSQRLERQGLTMEESLALLRHAAEALAVAHARGIIHRDLKPSNLFLRHGAPEGVTLLDFGIARHVAHSLNMTASGAVLGTPGFMAPEQVIGRSDISPAVDIFSLGCVLYLCLGGKAPFEAMHGAAVLGKILFAEPTPLRELRPELPEPLLALVLRMLAKDRRHRFSSAGELVEALKALEPLAGAPPLAPGAPSASQSLAHAEQQQLVSVLLATPVGRPAEEPKVALAQRADLRDSLRALLVPHGAAVELLADGSLTVALLLQRGTATDQAVLAARSALWLKERWSDAAVAVVTGRGSFGGHHVTGDVMDRAGQLLRQFGQPPAASAAHVMLDEVTAQLLGPGFQLDRPGSGLILLQGEHLSRDASRPLLGKPTPCVGRERELAMLGLELDTCAEVSAARAVLVAGPAGVGKSRLRREFLLRLERKGQQVLVLQAQGDPMGSGTTGGLLGQALRQLCGVGTEGEPLELKQQRLWQRLARHLPPHEAPAVLEALGELCGIPLADPAGASSHPAGAEPKALGAQLEQALKSFFLAECRQGPVLLVLEDLHWGDAFSIKCVEELLGALAEQPFVVLALARPEVRQLFPHLWSHFLQEISLRGPGRKACARLVREVLGPDVAEPVVDHLVEQCADNMLFLEELIRGVAEGRGEGAPETVLAILQARLSRLAPEERQLLLAASVFGRIFWAGGAEALLQREAAPASMPSLFRRLVELELIQERPTSRFPSEVEYSFRHALVRDAAYSLMPESFKPTGHRLAGSWLEKRGESDPRVLARHARLGQQPERAIQFYLLATEQLMNRHALTEAVQCMDAALELNPSAEVRSRLSAMRAMASFWAHDTEQVGETRHVLSELRVGSVEWCKLVGGLLFTQQVGGKHEEAARLAEWLWHTLPEEGAAAAWLEAGYLLSAALTFTGERTRALAWQERMDEIQGAHDAGSPEGRGWLLLAHCFVSYHLDARLWQALSQARQSCEIFQQLGVQDYAGPQVIGGLAQVALGDLPGGLVALRECLAQARRGAPVSLSFARSYFAVVLASLPQQAHQEEARALALEEIEFGASIPMFTLMALIALARVALARGELVEAEAHLRKVIEPPFPIFRPLARATLSHVLRGQGRLAEARHQAELGCQELERMGGHGMGSAEIRLALAEACFSEGDAEAGERALRKAWEGLRAHAADIPEEPLRERFLHGRRRP